MKGFFFFAVKRPIEIILKVKHFQTNYLTQFNKHIHNPVLYFSIFAPEFAAKV